MANNQKSDIKKIIWIGILLAVILFGIGGLVLYGFITPIVFVFGALSLAGISTSYIIFGVFGLLLLRKFRLRNAILMLGFTYTIWEMLNASIINTLQFLNLEPRIHTNPPTIEIFSLWSIIILTSTLIVRPKYNFNHIASILLFIEYSQHPFSYFHYHTELADVLDNTTSIIIWIYFVWKTFSERI